MGKHDIKGGAIMADPYTEARALKLEQERNAYREQCRELQERLNRVQKVISEIEALAKERLDERDARIAELEAALLIHAVRPYVQV